MEWNKTGFNLMYLYSREKWSEIGGFSDNSVWQKKDPNAADINL